MNSKIDPIMFLKKDNHFNDSIDRSLVNEYVNKSTGDIFLEIIKNSFIIIFPIFILFLIEITNMLIFTYDINEKTSNYVTLRHYILVEIYYYFFGFIFLLGAMKYFESLINYDKREVKLKLVYYSYSRIFYLFSALLIILPLCLVSYSLLSYIFYNDADIQYFWEYFLKYLIYLPLIFYFSINFQLNLQILKIYDSFFYIIISHTIIYWFILYMNSYYIANKIHLITISLLMNNFIALIISHLEVKRNVGYLKDINILIYEDFILVKWENFFNFIKSSVVKGILFNFRYLGIAMILYTSFFLGQTYFLATSLAILVMSFPHLFTLGASKYYKNYLENSVYDHSQNTKSRYLRYFWWIILCSTILFSFIILILKSVIFKIFFNLYEKYFVTVTFDQNSLEIFNIYNNIVKFYSLFIIFDSIGNSFQEILKSFNDHSRNYLSFYKGISLIIFFIPLGIMLCYFFEYDLFAGFWIGIYVQMVVYSLILLVILYKNYKNSTFPSC